MNLRVFYLYKTVGFGWLLYFSPSSHSPILKSGELAKAVMVG